MLKDSASLSLAGKTIVVTRSVRGNLAWKKYLKDRGADVYEFPTITIMPVEPTAELVRALRNLADFDWIVFTSAAGLHAMRTVAKKAAIDISPERVPPLTVVGPATAAAARKMGYQIAFMPTTANSNKLGHELTMDEKGESILLLRSDIASKELPEHLAEHGAKVTDLPIYRTVFIHDQDPAFEKLIAVGKIDFLIFASPSAVKGFCARISNSEILKAAKKIPTIALGPGVQKTLLEIGFKNVQTTKEPTIEDGVLTIMKHGVK